LDNENESIVGKIIRIFWPTDGKFYKAKVNSFDATSNLHSIQYDDGEDEDILLENEKWEMLLDESEGEEEKGMESGDEGSEASFQDDEEEEEDDEDFDDNEESNDNWLVEEEEEDEEEVMKHSSNNRKKSKKRKKPPLSTPSSTTTKKQRTSPSTNSLLAFTPSPTTSSTPSSFTPPSSQTTPMRASPILEASLDSSGGSGKKAGVLGF